MLRYETLDCLNILEMLMELFKQPVNPVRFKTAHPSPLSVASGSTAHHAVYQRGVSL